MSETTNTSRAWAEPEIRELLAREDFRYQAIDLPFGLTTGGYDRSSTANRILPEDLTGKTVLDVGSSFGYFCFEAERRGAARVVGYDVDPDSIRKSRLLAEIRGSAVEFRQVDLDRESPVDRFDYVLGLNLLHHLRDPIGGLDKLLAMTRETLVLETAAVGRHDRKKLRIGPIARFFARRMPVIYAARSGTRGKRETQRFYIARSAIENLLLYQRGSIARLESFDSEHKGRYISIARKRRIDHLLVVSSPTSAGKKTLMRRLVANELPGLAEAIGTPDASVWGQPTNANRLFEPDRPHRERMLLHHDFLRPFLRSTMTHERDEANEIIELADARTLVTIWAPPERLVEQITEAEITTNERKSRRHLRIRKEYEDPARVIVHYERWFEYTARFDAPHFVVSFEDDQLVIRTPEEWATDVAPAYR